MASIGLSWGRGGRHLPRPRWRRVLVVAAMVAGAVVLSTAAFIAVSYAFRDRPGPRSVDSALRQFRRDTATTAAHVATPTSAPSGPRVTRPPAGVYELAGQGSEHISFPPNSQSDGAVMPASVVYLGDGCWRWRVDYNVAHWEEYDFCTQSGVTRQTANRNGQTWDFGTTKISNRAEFLCPAGVVILPADPRPGDSSSQSCTGTNTAVAGSTQARGPVRIVGTEQLTIGGRSVAAVHEVQQITLAGAQTGTVVEDWWLVASSGLPVRVERHITIGTKSPLGTITYTENGSWQMSSLSPRS